jgi:hypothetical protein
VTVRLLATARRPLNGRSIFLSRLFRGSIGAVALAPSGLIAGERGEQENAPGRAAVAFGSIPYFSLEFDPPESFRA